MPAFLYIVSTVSYRRAISHMVWETFEKAAERIQGVSEDNLAASSQRPEICEIGSSVLDPSGGFLGWPLHIHGKTMTTKTMAISRVASL